MRQLCPSLRESREDKTQHYENLISACGIIKHEIFFIHSLLLLLASFFIFIKFLIFNEPIRILAEMTLILYS